MADDECNMHLRSALGDDDKSTRPSVRRRGSRSRALVHANALASHNPPLPTEHSCRRRHRFRTLGTEGSNVKTMRKTAGSRLRDSTYTPLHGRACPISPLTPPAPPAIPVLPYACDTPSAADAHRPSLAAPSLVCLAAGGFGSFGTYGHARRSATKSRMTRHTASGRTQSQSQGAHSLQMHSQQTQAWAAHAQYVVAGLRGCRPVAIPSRQAVLAQCSPGAHPQPPCAPPIQRGMWAGYPSQPRTYQQPDTPANATPTPTEKPADFDTSQSPAGEVAAASRGLKVAPPHPTPALGPPAQWRTGASGLRRLWQPAGHRRGRARRHRAEARPSGKWHKLKQGLCYSELPCVGLQSTRGPNGGYRCRH
ncbi:hypothetical protein BJ912DRAFT_1070068 [Pholiota molesta]|nr:hypothetical protein BJ912DRAFT_1070068 [Pholiota molesta]